MDLSFFSCSFLYLRSSRLSSFLHIPFLFCCFFLFIRLSIYFWLCLLVLRINFISEPSPFRFFPYSCIIYIHICISFYVHLSVSPCFSIPYLPISLQLLVSSFWLAIALSSPLLSHIQGLMSSVENIHVFQTQTGSFQTNYDSIFNIYELRKQLRSHSIGFYCRFTYHACFNCLNLLFRFQVYTLFLRERERHTHTHTHTLSLSLSLCVCVGLYLCFQLDVIV